MPRNQAPAMRAALDRVETELGKAADTADLGHVRRVLSHPPQIGVADQTLLFALLASIEQQLVSLQTLRSGLLAAIKQLATPDSD